MFTCVALPSRQSPPTSPLAARLPQRDAFNPGFASAFLKEAVPQFVECTRHLIARLEAAADESALQDAARAGGAPAAAAAAGRPAAGSAVVEGLAAAPSAPGVVLMHHMVILLVGARKSGGRRSTEGQRERFWARPLGGVGRAGGSLRGKPLNPWSRRPSSAPPPAPRSPPCPCRPRWRPRLGQTLEVILRVGFGEEIDFLSPAGPGAGSPLLASFVKLGRHVS
jgi:hypothetical protein